MEDTAADRFVARVARGISAEMTRVPVVPQARRNLRVGLEAVDARGAWRRRLADSLFSTGPRFALVTAAAVAVFFLAGLAVFQTGAGSTILTGKLLYRTGTLASAPSSSALYAGAVIETGADGGAILDVGPHAEIALASASRLVVRDDTHVELLSGRVWTHVRPGHGDFFVETPNGHVEVHGTTFTVEVNGERTDLTVHEGLVEIGIGTNCIDVPAGSGAAADRGRIIPAAPVDASQPGWAAALWEGYWNQQSQSFFPSARKVGTSPR